MNVKDNIAKRIAMELRHGDVVNLGIGIPTQVPDFLIPGIEVFVHSENGILGVGPTPDDEEVDVDLVNAGKLPVTIQFGASFFDSAASFGMIRGGHVDVAVLGALQVDACGRVANWRIPGQGVLGVGGAMDLMEGARKLIVATTHNAKDGSPKLVEVVKYPLTSTRSADLIVTEIAVFAVQNGQLVLMEISENVTLDTVRSRTEAHFEVSGALGIMGSRQFSE